MSTWLVSDARPVLWEEVPEENDFRPNLYPTYHKGQTCNATPYTTGLWIECVYTVSAMLFVMSLKGL